MGHVHLGVACLAVGLVVSFSVSERSRRAGESREAEQESSPHVAGKGRCREGWREFRRRMRWRA